jgi:alpha-amylase
MTKAAMVDPQSSKNTKPSELLRSLPFEKGFHFYTGEGQDTGVTATSLPEFAEKLQKIPVESVSFHSQRGDFQEWLRGVVGDEELARRIDRIKTRGSGSSGENLRKELLRTVQVRLSKLRPSS